MGSRPKQVLRKTLKPDPVETRQVYQAKSELFLLLGNISYSDSDSIHRIPTPNLRIYLTLKTIISQSRPAGHQSNTCISSRIMTSNSTYQSHPDTTSRQRLNTPLTKVVLVALPHTRIGIGSNTRLARKRNKQIPRFIASHRIASHVKETKLGSNSSREKRYSKSQSRYYDWINISYPAAGLYLT